MINVSDQDLVVIATFGMAIIVLYFIVPIFLYTKNYQEVLEGRKKLHNLIFMTLFLHVSLILLSYLAIYAFSVAQQQFGAKSHYLFSYVGVFFSTDWSLVLEQIPIVGNEKFSMLSFINLIYVGFNMILYLLPLGMIYYLVSGYFENLSVNKNTPFFQSLTDLFSSSFVSIIAVTLHTLIPFMFIEDMANSKVAKADYKILSQNIGANNIKINYTQRMKYLLTE